MPTIFQPPPPAGPWLTPWADSLVMHNGALLGAPIVTHVDVDYAGASPVPVLGPLVEGHTYTLDFEPITAPNAGQVVLQVRKVADAGTIVAKATAAATDPVSSVIRHIGTVDATSGAALRSTGPLTIVRTGQGPVPMECVVTKSGGAATGMMRLWLYDYPIVREA